MRTTRTGVNYKREFQKSYIEDMYSNGQTINIIHLCAKYNSETEDTNKYIDKKRAKSLLKSLEKEQKVKQIDEENWKRL